MRNQLVIVSFNLLNFSGCQVSVDGERGQPSKSHEFILNFHFISTQLMKSWSPGDTRKGQN